MIETNVAHRLELFPGQVTHVSREENVISFQTENDILLMVHVLDDHIVRFRYQTDSIQTEDFSYAINNKFRGKLNYIECLDEEVEYTIQTAAVIVKIDKANLRIKVTDLDGTVINQDEKGFHWEENKKHGGNIVMMSKLVQSAEHYFGMGDKPMHLNLRGRRLKIWGMDEYGFKSNTDPLYKNIPFYIGLHNGLAYGIFFDNSFNSNFDFASERRTATSFWANGGEMNYYFINGPKLIEVSERYTMLTGTPELPPLWSLGFQQSKWSYYPESKVMEIANKFRELNIPCDAIYLDIDYMDGFRCFTWDNEKFPNPKGMIEELKSKGFKTVAIIDPGIKVDKEYDIFQQGLENDYFCRRADGPFMKGKVWPGECYFPDFTNPKVRKWWASLFQDLIQEKGIAGIWNDMNEPAVFEVESKTFPDDVRHDYDGHPCSHRKAHNVYGMQMSRATYKGVKKFGKPNRPFVITRSTYSGGQRYASSWTGDNLANWEHIWVANVQCQRLSISGFSFIGSDIGGFIDQPSSELLVRWTQLGIFHPFCRNHSSGDHGNQEPWVFSDESTNIIRKFIELRYQLLPYLYTSFYHYVNRGTPMVRPISFYDQSDPDILFREDEFMCGDHLLIAPIQEQNAKGRYMYLPKGDWYSFWNDTLLKGGMEQWIDAPLDEIPMFVKPGAILPFNPVMQYVGEKQIEELTLHVYYKEGEEESVLYEDLGQGYDYENGIYTITRFALSGTKNSMKIVRKSVGHYVPTYNTYKIVLHGLPFDIGTVEVNGKELENHCFVKNQDETYSFDANREFLEIRISKLEA